MLILFAFTALVLAACSGGAPGPAPAPVASHTPALVAALSTTVAQAPAPAAPTAAPLPAVTSTPTPTDTPAPTDTQSLTVTPTATPLDPLTITAMREREYVGSDIKIEQTLKAGFNYQRYITSYLSDGLKIYGLLTVPNGKPPATGWPVVVFNHGYIPPFQYRTTERYVAYQDGFARNGYITFKSDYRGHGNSEGVAVGGYGSPDYTVDVLNALASLKRYPGADANRIGMWGHSMGGSVTLRTMVVSKDIKAGVIWSGVVAPYTDLYSRWHQPVHHLPPGVPDRQRRWRQDLTAKYGTPEQNPAFWASISPSNYVADLSGPLQLQAATGDTEVPVQFSRDLYAKVQAAGKPVQYYEYKGDDHNLSADFNTAMQRSIAFFDKYVKGNR